MPPFGETELIDEGSLGSGDLIELYKELLRIIEKDIDNLAIIKSGFTPWSLLTALGAVGLILFGLGKGIFEADARLVGLTYLFSYFALQSLYILVSSIDFYNSIKPNRVYFPRERFGYYPALIFRWISFVISIVVAYRVWEWGPSFILAMLGLLLVGFIYVTMAIPLLLNPLTGNNPRFEKVGTVFSTILNIGSGIMVVSSFLFLPWPEESTASSFAIGGLLAVLIVLAELYIVVACPNPLIKRLTILRDDIIFRRKSLNDALLELRRIREGITYFEALATEIELVNSKTNEKFATFEAARGLLHSIEGLLSSIASDGSNTDCVLEQIAPYEHAYNVAKSNVIRLKSEIDEATRKLTEKSAKVITVSGDFDSPELFDSYFNETHRQLNSDILELNMKESEIGDKINSLRNRTISIKDGTIITES